MKEHIAIYLKMTTMLLIACLAACSTTSDSADKISDNATSIEDTTVENKSPPERSINEASSVVFKKLVPFTEYETSDIPAGNESSYEIDLKMEENGTFQANARIDITNTSGETWDTIQFYFIPNAFTEENKPSFMETAAETTIDAILVEGKKVKYSLEYSTLAVQLEKSLDDGERTTVEVSYTFTVPEHGFRFSQIGRNYYLAQWYPMLATYRDGWNLMDYHTTGESYHTGFSDFIVHYTIPEGYTVYSTADQEDNNEKISATLQIDHVKEFYLAITKTADMLVERNVINDTEIRVIGRKADKFLMHEVAFISNFAFRFFEEHIGEYPHKQLDILVDDGGMEYPGIVTVGAINKDMDLQDKAAVVAHEIAHQWFYGVVTNDPYYDAWIDEGINEFATSIFLMENWDFSLEESFAYLYRSYEDAAAADLLIAVNLPIDHYGERYGANVYVQPALQLHKLFRTDQGSERALDFLRHYYEQYQYKEVDTEEFLNFLRAYLQLEDVSVFAEWINMKNE